MDGIRDVVESRALSYERERVREEKKGKRMHEQVEIAIVSRADFFAVNDDHRVTGSSISWKRETLSRDRSNSLSPIPCFSKFLLFSFLFFDPSRLEPSGTESRSVSVFVVTITIQRHSTFFSIPSSSLSRNFPS